jgi:hypothetical protein
MKGRPQLPLFEMPEDYDEHLSDAVAARLFTMAGRCSGIPDCCIDAFITNRLNALPESAKQAGSAKRVGYRQCERCAATGYVVTVRRCPATRCACAAAKDFLFSMPRSVRSAWLDVAEPMLVVRSIRGQ